MFWNSGHAWSLCSYNKSYFNVKCVREPSSPCECYINDKGEKYQQETCQIIVDFELPSTDTQADKWCYSL